MMLLNVQGVEVAVTRKKVKNLNLRVLPDGRAAASAPLTMPQAEIERFLHSQGDWIVAHRDKLANSPARVAEEASPEEIRSWRAVVQAGTEVLVRKWEPIMGAHASELAYRNMRSRWGSCQPMTGRICINVRLALYPPRCLEYIVVHELCHLLQPGHGPRFWELMTRFLPDWKESRALLR